MRNVIAACLASISMVASFPPPTPAEFTAWGLSPGISQQAARRVTSIGINTDVEFERYSDNSIRGRVQHGSERGEWFSLRGDARGNPTVVHVGDGRFFVFVRSVDRRLYFQFGQPGATPWDLQMLDGWKDLGGLVHSDPWIADSGRDYVKVCVIGGSEVQTYCRVWRKPL